VTAAVALSTSWRGSRVAPVRNCHARSRPGGMRPRPAGAPRADNRPSSPHDVSLCRPRSFRSEADIGRRIVPIISPLLDPYATLGRPESRSAAVSRRGILSVESTGGTGQ
jgi:hypothetical protein